MANIILRANIRDKNINIEHKVLPLPISNNVVELTISPVSGYSISVNDFSHGFLPQQVRTINFVESGKNIVAEITLRKGIDSKKTLNLPLPIIAKSKLEIDRFKLIDNTNLTDKNIIIQNRSSFNKSVNQNKTTYSVTKKVDEKVLVLSKTLLTTGDRYFTKEPSYSIIGNADRYSSNNSVARNHHGKIIKKTFNIYYSSPEELLVKDTEDTISFQAETDNPKPSLKNKVATKPEEHKIYSFDTGRTIGAEGGIKRISVKGVPGTTFRIIEQDVDKKTYNFKTGVFEAGGGMFFGTIPTPMRGRSYGEYILYVKVPKSTSASSTSTKLITDRVIDHTPGVDIAEKYTPVVETTITPTSSITFSLFSSGFTIPFTNDAGTANLVIGPGSYKSIGEEAIFNVIIKAATAQVIRIERQPLHSTTIAYTNWDSGSDKAEALTSTGATISNDWYVADAKSTKYSISAKCKGLGKAHGTYTDGYKEVQIKGTISGVTFGTGDITVSLDLLNFLTLQAI
jgi:hypothetical protein